MPTYRNPQATDDRLVQTRWRTWTIRPGQAPGRLLGGNLTVLAGLVGTPYLPAFDGAILFLKDTDAAPYRLDRMLPQLAPAAGPRRPRGPEVGPCHPPHPTPP